MSILYPKNALKNSACSFSESSSFFGVSAGVSGFLFCPVKDFRFIISLGPSLFNTITGNFFNNFISSCLFLSNTSFAVENFKEFLCYGMNVNTGVLTFPQEGRFL